MVVQEIANAAQVGIAANPQGRYLTPGGWSARRSGTIKARKNQAEARCWASQAHWRLQVRLTPSWPNPHTLGPSVWEPPLVVYFFICSQLLIYWNWMKLKLKFLLETSKNCASLLFISVSTRTANSEDGSGRNMSSKIVSSQSHLLMKKKNHLPLSTPPKWLLLQGALYIR